MVANHIVDIARRREIGRCYCEYAHISRLGAGRRGRRSVSSAA